MVQTAVIIALTVAALLVFFLAISLYWCWKDSNDNETKTSRVEEIIKDKRLDGDDSGTADDVDVP